MSWNRTIVIGLFSEKKKFPFKKKCWLDSSGKKKVE
jgi:hypothetical protein